MRKIIIFVITSTLFISSAFIIYEYGFHWNEKTPHAQLTFISTVAVFCLPLILLILQWLKNSDDREYQEQKRKEEREHYEMLIKKERDKLRYLNRTRRRR